MRGRAGGVRVKGWGKSPPRDWQQDRHGKPHREQDRIGTTRVPLAVPQPVSGPVVRVGCERRRASAVPDEWLPRSGARTGAIQNPAYRPTGDFTSPAAQPGEGFVFPQHFGSNPRVLLLSKCRGFPYWLCLRVLAMPRISLMFPAVQRLRPDFDAALRRLMARIEARLANPLLNLTGHKYLTRSPVRGAASH
jgi:hypothetical protein